VATAGSSAYTAGARASWVGHGAGVRGRLRAFGWRQRWQLWVARWRPVWCYWRRLRLARWHGWWHHEHGLRPVRVHRLGAVGGPAQGVTTWLAGPWWSGGGASGHLHAALGTKEEMVVLLVPSPRQLCGFCVALVAGPSGWY
jgi:hypothetical protein